MALQELKNKLLAMSSPEKAAKSVRFFKTGKGQYSEGDVFIGVVYKCQAQCCAMRLKNFRKKSDERI